MSVDAQIYRAGDLQLSHTYFALLGVVDTPFKLTWLCLPDPLSLRSLIAVD